MVYLNNNVSGRRDLLELTQSDLAKSVNSTISTIDAIENKNFNCSIELALLIANALDSSVDDLFWISSERSIL